MAAAAVAAIDLRSHVGVHPRLGAADVVPFVPLSAPRTDRPTDCGARPLGARDRFAAWAGAELALPCFLYGPERSLPDVRRHAFVSLAPDTGPPSPHPTAGAAAVGARPVLVAYNVWIAADRPGDRRRTGPCAVGGRGLAARCGGRGVRSLGLAVGEGAQVSCNLTDPAPRPSPASTTRWPAGPRPGAAR